MTVPIVLQLQADCLNESVPISTLLRKAKLIASKLDLTDLSGWIESELSGYRGKLSDLPEYRVGGGVPKFFNPYRGWCDIIIENQQFSEMLSTARMPQPVAELENLLNSEEGSTVIFTIPDVLENAIFEGRPQRFRTGLFVSKSFLHSALDRAKNIILEWSLALESRGILGEGLTFTHTEKLKAQSVNNFHIYGANIGNIGNVDGNVINSKFKHSDGSMNRSSLKSTASQIVDAIPALPKLMQSEIIEPVRMLQEIVEAPEISQNDVASIFSTIRKILEGAAGNLAASAIISAISS